jgi:hypothetical protein
MTCNPVYACPHYTWCAKDCGRTRGLVTLHCVLCVCVGGGGERQLVMTSCHLSNHICRQASDSEKRSKNICEEIKMTFRINFTRSLFSKAYCWTVFLFKPLKPSGYYTYHPLWQRHTLQFVHTTCLGLCAFCDSHNRQRLCSWAELTITWPVFCDLRR